MVVATPRRLAVPVDYGGFAAVATAYALATPAGYNLDTDTVPRRPATSCRPPPTATPGEVEVGADLAALVRAGVHLRPELRRAGDPPRLAAALAVCRALAAPVE